MREQANFASVILTLAMIIAVPSSLEADDSTRSKMELEFVQKVCNLKFDEANFYVDAGLIDLKNPASGTPFLFEVFRLCLYADTVKVKYILGLSGYPRGLHSSRDRWSGRAVFQTTLLILACGWGRDKTVVPLFISYGADPNLHDEFGMPPLFYCVNSGNIPGTQAIIARNADVNFRFPKEFSTRAPHMPAVGVNVNLLAFASRPILDFAIARAADTTLDGRLGRFETMKLLAENGAKASPDSIHLLYDPTAFKNEIYCKETQRCTTDLYHHRILDVILDAGADINARYDGKTLAKRFVEAGYVNAAKLILAKGGEL